MRLSIAAAALLLLPLGSCGGDDSSAEPPAEPAGAPLEIELDRDGPGGEPPEAEALRCPGAAARKCDLLAALPPAASAPIPPDVPCTEIYGGPDLVRVTGTLDGERIDLELTRANGCEIERFGHWVPLLRELFPGYRPGAALRPG